MSNRIALAAIALTSIVTISAPAADLVVSPAGPYTTIQAAINAAANGDTVIVHPGVYVENIDFEGKTIGLTSVDPADRAITESTIIDGGGWGSVVTLSQAQGADCLLAGFTIRNGDTAERGGGINGNGTGAAISNCIVEQNLSDLTGAGIFNCQGLISNCIIRNNTTRTSGGGLAACNGIIVNCLIVDNEAPKAGALHNCDGQIVNCTIADNRSAIGVGLSDCDAEIVNCIIWGAEGGLLVDSSLPVASCFPNYMGGYGNCDPAFLSPGDYNLRPDSLCIDAGTNNPTGGLPTTDLYGRPRILDGNGDGDARVDIGAYEFDPQAGYFKLSTHAFEFNAVEGQALYESQILTIENAGGGTLNWKIQGNCEWLTVTPTSGQTGDNPTEIAVIPDVARFAKGRYICPLTFSDPLAVNSPCTITATLYVRVEGQLSVPAVHPTIQAAIDIAANGDVIVVDDGVYSGPGNINIDFKGKAITLRSQNGPEKCIIDCQNQDRGFFFHNNEGPDSIVEGFTVTNGYAGSAEHGTQSVYGNGGAVCNLQSSPTFRNCRFVENAAAVHGILRLGNGGAMFNDNSDPTLIACTFINNDAEWGGALLNSGRSNPSLFHCLFSGNKAYYGGAIATLQGASVTLVNCTLTANRISTALGGAGIHNAGAKAILTNCILWANVVVHGSGDLEAAQVYTGPSAVLTLYHNCIQGWTGKLGGIGNVSRYPHFVNEGHWNDQGTYETTDDIWIDGDYHLKSEGWRWDASGKRWTYDEATSPCIDAGNPGTPLGDEPLAVPADPLNVWGENIRVNMGAYGGTAEASMAPPGRTLLCDITNDHAVDLADLLFVAEYWLQTGCSAPDWCAGADVDRNTHLSLPDLGAFSQQWQVRTAPLDAAAHWRLDGNFYDSAGYYHGTPVGDPAFVNEHIAAEGTAALRLEEGQRVVFADYAGIGGKQSRTLCAWIKTVDREGALVSWGQNGIPGGRWVWRTQEDGFMRLEVGGGSIVGGTFVCDDNWHHVAVVLASDATPNVDEVRLFVDGRDDPAGAVAPRTIDTVTFAAPVVRLGTYNPIGYAYHGLIDDVRIYDRALTPEEIAELAK